MINSIYEITFWIMSLVFAAFFGRVVVVFIRDVLNVLSKERDYRTPFATIYSNEVISVANGY